MTLPFTPQQFLDVFAAYNTAVWPAQAVLYVLGLLAAMLAALRGTRSSRTVSAILAALWLWMALLYHWTFFRTINPAAQFFAAAFVVQAALFALIGVVRSTLVFNERYAPARLAGAVMILYALVAYPLLNLAFGHRYPRMPTFGLPCPTTIFTLGVLLFAQHRARRIVLVVPTLWALVGLSAGISLGVREDLGLPVAALAALALTFGPRKETARTARSRDCSDHEMTPVGISLKTVKSDAWRRGYVSARLTVSANSCQIRWGRATATKRAKYAPPARASLPMPSRPLR